MEPIDQLSMHQALQFAALAVPVLKHLAATDRTMTHKEFGQAIGVVRRAWRAGHQHQVATVLRTIEAVTDYLNAPQLELGRITDGKTEGHWYQRQWIKTGAPRT
jgi:hypothetical protein